MTNFFHLSALMSVVVVVYICICILFQDQRRIQPFNKTSNIVMYSSTANRSRNFYMNKEITTKVGQAGKVLNLISYFDISRELIAFFVALNTRPLGLHVNFTFLSGAASKKKLFCF